MALATHIYSLGIKGISWETMIGKFDLVKNSMFLGNYFSHPFYGFFLIRYKKPK